MWLREDDNSEQGERAFRRAYISPEKMSHRTAGVWREYGKMFKTVECNDESV